MSLITPPVHQMGLEQVLNAAATDFFKNGNRLTFYVQKDNSEALYFESSSSRERFDVKRSFLKLFLAHIENFKPGVTLTQSFSVMNCDTGKQVCQLNEDELHLFDPTLNLAKKVHAFYIGIEHNLSI
jgi:hypothetical protein